MGTVWRRAVVVGRFRKIVMWPLRVEKKLESDTSGSANRGQRIRVSVAYLIKTWMSWWKT
jgi:hypothetical protein